MSTEVEPAYLALHRTGELQARADEARKRLAACDLCAWVCGVDRTDARDPNGSLGQCRTGERAVVCSCHAHFGEEPPLVGFHGSGTIFFSWCNLHCRFCQNCELSAFGQGRETGPNALARMMLELQSMRCHNINFVSPSHVVAQILDALVLAADKGLRLPLVYNTGGYDSLNTLRLLDGVFDIYMPDMKYADPDMGQRLSGVSDYPAVNQAAVKEMHRQVGDLVTDDRGIAQRGLLIRHLVLPDRLAGTAEIVRFLADEVSTNTYLNLMDQYRPCHEARQLPPLNRSITSVEFDEAILLAQQAGLERGER
jgi:putative pyruvate formate lyase activating enzyme